MVIKRYLKKGQPGFNPGCPLVLEIYEEIY